MKYKNCGFEPVWVKIVSKSEKSVDLTAYNWAMSKGILNVRAFERKERTKKKKEGKVKKKRKVTIRE